MGEQSRAEHLSALGPLGWYTDHAISRPKPCVCGLTGPDPSCDLGEALYRLSIKERVRTFPGIGCGNPRCPRHGKK